MADLRYPAVAFVSLLAVVLAGCTSGAAPTPTAAPLPTSSYAAPSACPAIDLRSPSGEPIDLSGTWRGSNEGPNWYVFQTGTCVWIAGSFYAPDVSPTGGPLGYTTVVFDGQLGSDFIITGRWAEARRARSNPGTNRWGSVTFEVGFGESGEAELRVVAFTSIGHREDIVSGFPDALAKISVVYLDP
jgi:hypothetical protein